MSMLKVVSSVVKRRCIAFRQSPLDGFAVLGVLVIGIQIGLSSLSSSASSTESGSIGNAQTSVESLTVLALKSKITQLNMAKIQRMVDLINQPSSPIEGQPEALVGIHPAKLNQADIKHKDSIARFVFTPSPKATVFTPASTTFNTAATTATAAKVATARINSASTNKQYQFKPSTDSTLGQTTTSNLFDSNVVLAKTLAIWNINKKFSLTNKRENISATGKSKAHNKFVIMLDPGHGGIDPGSIGHNGLEEKALTLEIAKRAALFLSEIDNIEVVLTRDDDTGMSRSNRVKKVKQSNADLIVSIHLNHLPQADINLVETFYAAPHNILESIETQRAEENANDLLKTASTHNHDLSFTKGSQQLASIMQKRVFDEVSNNNPNTDNAGVKEDMLYILTRSFTPGVLIEMSCLSNVDEAENLADPAYRDKLAAALADGIRDYLSTPEAKGQFGPGV